MRCIVVLFDCLAIVRLHYQAKIRSESLQRGRLLSDESRSDSAGIYQQKALSTDGRGIHLWIFVLPRISMRYHELSFLPNLFIFFVMSTLKDIKASGALQRKFHLTMLSLS